MPKSKSRGKRHNPNARAKTFFNNAFRVWTWEAERGEDGTQIAYAQKHLGTFWRDVGPKITGGVLVRPQNWAVCIRAIGCNDSGPYWVEDATVIVRDTALNDLEALYLKYRAEVLEACQIKNVYDCGWLAQTYDTRNPADNPKWPLVEQGALTRERQGIWQEVNAELKEAKAA